MKSSKENRKVNTKKILKPPIQEYLKTESDERLVYLLDYGKVIRSDHDFNAIFAELPQIPGVWIFYRKDVLRVQNPRSLFFANHQLNHIPLMEGKFREKNFEF